MDNVIQKLKELVSETLKEKGYELVDLKYGKKGGNWFLQIFVDKVSKSGMDDPQGKECGITIKDCKIISEFLGYTLDRNPELIGVDYNLEVSSPGLNRELKTEEDFNKSTGKSVKIKLYKPIENYRIWRGRILYAENGKVIIEDVENQQRVVNIENIIRACLEIRFTELTL